MAAGRQFFACRPGNSVDQWRWRAMDGLAGIGTMVHSEHVQQAALADDDDSVVAALESLPVERSPGDELLVLGLRNAEGLVYRRFEVQGMRMALRISNLLREFGYTAEQGGGAMPSSGCRIVFTRTARIPREHLNS